MSKEQRWLGLKEAIESGRIKITMPAYGAWDFGESGVAAKYWNEQRFKEQYSPYPNSSSVIEGECELVPDNGIVVNILSTDSPEMVGLKTLNAISPETIYDSECEDITDRRALPKLED